MVLWPNLQPVEVCSLLLAVYAQSFSDSEAIVRDRFSFLLALPLKSLKPRMVKQSSLMPGKGRVPPSLARSALFENPGVGPRAIVYFLMT
jgi:hypothetical protein